MAGPRADDLVFVFLLLSVPLPPAAAMTQEVGSLSRISDKHNIEIAGFRSFSKSIFLGRSGTFHNLAFVVS